MSGRLGALRLPGCRCRRLGRGEDRPAVAFAGGAGVSGPWPLPLFGFAAMGKDNESDEADRAISTGKLHSLLRFHTRPIDVVVYHGSDREYWF